MHVFSTQGLTPSNMQSSPHTWSKWGVPPPPHFLSPFPGLFPLLSPSSMLRENLALGIDLPKIDLFS
jgi:hypothetical protein